MKQEWSDAAAVGEPATEAVKTYPVRIDGGRVYLSLE